MTAQYQIDVTGGWGYLGIVDAIYLPAQVGDADDDITLLFLLQYLYFDEMGLYAFSSGINLILIVTILICNALVNKVTGASLDKGIGG